VIIGVFALFLATNGYFFVRAWLRADREWWEVAFFLFLVTAWAFSLRREIRRPRAEPVSE
jgi:hypothetical protein